MRLACLAERAPLIAAMVAPAVTAPMHEAEAHAAAELQTHPGTQTQGMFTDPIMRSDADRFDGGYPGASDET